MELALDSRLVRNARLSMVIHACLHHTRRSDLAHA